MKNSKSIAVIGGGVAGVVSSYLLSKEHNVHLFEANTYLGGHTNTHQLTKGPDAGVGVDTGFIVLNDTNYPLFHRFLRALSVETRWSDMSFAYHDQNTDFQYAGTTINGLFAQRQNIASPTFWLFLYQLCKFGNSASKDLSRGIGRMSLGEYLSLKSVSPKLLNDYLLPMGAAIWSAPLAEVLDFPAESFLRFFKNHGLLSLRNRPRWQTVVGGSSAYITAFKNQFTGTISLNTPVKRIVRNAEHVVVEPANGDPQRFDAVVLATHADVSLALLDSPSPDEQRLLSPWNYQKNHTVLHTDSSLLPSLRRAWASWNYVRYRDTRNNSPVSVSYWMNMLQGLRTKEDYVVSLNCAERIDQQKILAEFQYEHPVFSQAALDTQHELPALNARNNTYFCGSYFGYGFHEDAVRSAVAVGEKWSIKL